MRQNFPVHENYDGDPANQNDEPIRFEQNYYDVQALTRLSAPRDRAPFKAQRRAITDRGGSEDEMKITSSGSVLKDESTRRDYDASV